MAFGKFGEKLDNLGDIMKIKGAWERFAGDHPKFMQFLGTVKAKGVPEGTVIGVYLQYPGGEKMETNLKVTTQDLELFEILSKTGR